MTPTERRKAYACDITYGTAKEFGFDFLRDRLLLRRIDRRADRPVGADAGPAGRQPAARSPCSARRTSALVDEADSILIDEARTPLIISALPTEDDKAEAELYKWARGRRAKFDEDEHYEYDHEDAKGRADRRRAGSWSATCRASRRHRAGGHVRALRVRSSGRIRVDRAFMRDRHYVDSRRRDRDRRRVHRPPGRRPQVARRPAPGDRSQRRRRRSRSTPARPRASPCRTSSSATRSWPA